MPSPCSLSLQLQSNSAPVIYRNNSSIVFHHQELLSLENNMKELRDLFFDIFMLVEEQGAYIEHIQTNVERTQDYVAVTNEKFKTAARYKKKNPLRQLCCCCCPPWRCCLWKVCAMTLNNILFQKVPLNFWGWATLDSSTNKVKVMALFFLLLSNTAKVETDSAEQRKQLGGKARIGIWGTCFFQKGWEWML